MNKKFDDIIAIVFGSLAMAILMHWIISLTGCGKGWQASVSIGGVYAVKEPGGYPVICFVEGGNVGGIFCMKESEVGGKK